LNIQEEANAPTVMPDGLHAQRGGQVRLASAWAAHQNDVVRLLHELATMELAHQCLVHLALGEVEASLNIELRQSSSSTTSSNRITEPSSDASGR
jgi:hypothetical protein